jgi:hypothetical protein
MKTLTLSILLLIFNIGLGQNKSFQIYEDSIFPFIENDYQKAKNNYLKCEQRYKFDPIYTMSFLEFALKNDDIAFFKKEIKKLIKLYGYSYSLLDTSGIAMGNPLNQQIHSKKLCFWLAFQSKKNHPKWVSKNPNSSLQSDILNTLYTKDQLIRKISFDLFPAMKEMDSLCYENFVHIYDSLITAIDANNIISLQNACIKNDNYLLNNFDNGYLSSKIVGLIISHNLKRGKYLNETWERLYPFVEQAYIDGKISDVLLYEYDFNLYKRYGYQYYGTLGEDIPIKDLETFNDRKKRLRL